MVDGIVQKHNFHSADDQDWIAFDAFNGLFYQSVIHLTSVRDVDSYLELFDTDGHTLLAFNDNIADDNLASAITFSPDQDGRYFLRVTNLKNIGSCFSYYSVRVMQVTPTPTPVITPLYLPLIRHKNGHPVYLPITRDDSQKQPIQHNPATSALAIAPNSGWIALAAPHALRLLDESGDLQHHLTAGPAPVALTFGPNNDLYISDSKLGKVWRIDSKSGQEQAVSAALGRPAGLVWAKNQLIVADTAGDRLLVLNDELQIRETHATGHAPYAIALHGTQLAVAHAGGDSISLHQIGDLGQRTDIALGGLGHPQALAFNDDGSRLYVVFLYTPKFHRVAEIDTSSAEVIRLIGGDYVRPMTGVYSLAIADNILLLPDSDQVHRYDLVADRWLLPDKRSISTSPFGLALSPQNELLLAPFMFVNQ